MIVKLTYFKPSGKYYSEGELDVPNDMRLDEVWDTVEKLLVDGRLPDLIGGHSNFIISVDAPSCEHNHPHLIIPNLWWKVLQAIEEHR